MFFFKQKTAYEMRISDWSSDVCSSDLRMIPVIRDFHAALDSIWREFFYGTRLDTVEVNTTLNTTLCLLRGMGVQTVLRQDPPYYDRQIGRASCRERVCQYV